MWKFSFLIGEWSDQNFWDNVYPLIKYSNLPIIKSKKISVHETMSLSNDKYDIVFMDDKILYFDDEIFLEYLNYVIKLSKKICLFELPFSISVDIKSIIRKTKLAYEYIKNKDDSICLISPAIDNTRISYFENNAKFFDAYAVHFYKEHNSVNIASITSALSKVIKFDKKKVYVTKYASPCYDKLLVNTFLNQEWEPGNSFDGAINIKNLCAALNKISNNIDYYYCGTYNDIYNQNNRKNFIEHSEFNKWEPIHFCGLCDYEGNLKEPLIHSIINHV